MAKRGFLAGLHRISKQAARERERQRKASQKAYAAAAKEVEAAVQAAEVAEKRQQQAIARAQKASATERKQLEKEIRELHEKSMTAEVERRNLQLQSMEEELETILQATIGVDDFVDLNTLRVEVEHPPFDRQDLLMPSRPPLPIIDSPKPELIEPPAPRGLLSFLSKSQYEKAKAVALTKHQADITRWHSEIANNEQLRIAEAGAYEERELERMAKLVQEEARYAADCSRREEEAKERNCAVDELISNLAYGMPDAVEEYIGIVLSNAVYPECFPISHDYSFDPESAELRLVVAVIPPDQFPNVKEYKYVKASDEISEVPFSLKACKDRYSSAIHQVALRVPHEVFEADRRGLISSISLEVGTHGLNPATGRPSFIPLVAYAVSRDEFMKIEIGSIQPSATLAHFGASVSKNPYGLNPANTTGVRRS